jgi:hypothetical protein
MRSLILALSVLFTLPTNPPTGYAGPSRTQYKTKKSAVENGAVPQISIRSDSTVINLLRAHDELPAAVWKRLLEVHSMNGTVLGHYLIFNLHGTFFSYSPDGGSKRIWPAGRSATAFGRAIYPDSSGIFFAPSNIVDNQSHLPDLF